MIDEQLGSSDQPGGAARRPAERRSATSIEPPRSGFVGPVKRSVTIAGHATSISLEPLFWSALEDEAARRHLPLNALVARIDALRITLPLAPNLASAIRSWLFETALLGAGAAGLMLVDYTDTLAHHFEAINAEWIEAMFTMEAIDREILTDPRGRIVDRGGAVLFVEAVGLGIVGTCALQKTGDRQFELTKMGVRAAARGRKAGEFLLAAMIDRAAALGAERLYLLTNHACAAAIHLYEKLGFVHDDGIMRDFGARYARCDVAMLYPPDGLALARGTSEPATGR